MNVFHHGGRIGDLVFALWTMKALGGGQLIVSDFQKDNWSLDIARTMERFLCYQDYITDVDFIEYDNINFSAVTHDLHAAELDHNPEAFPDYDPASGWPGNANIAQRYAVHFGLQFDGKPWLTAPKTRMVDVAMHVPLRRSLRSEAEWYSILDMKDEIEVFIVGREPLCDQLTEHFDLLNSADYINSSKCFLGVVSSMNAIAEGLGKKRFVEHSGDCWNVTRDVVINGWDNANVIESVKTWCAYGAEVIPQVQPKTFAVPLNAKINAGSGQRKFDAAHDWINIDINPKWEPDIVGNYNDLSMFPDESVDIVVAHHVIEHVGCGEADPFFREAYRVLRKNGSLLIFVPDLRALAQKWITRQIDDYTWNVNVYGAYMQDEADRHKWSYSPGSLSKTFYDNGVWSKVGPFDWRTVPGASLARDFWILAMEGVK